MTNLEWMVNKIKSQVRSVHKQISGLPENVQESVTNDCVDILRSKEKPKETFSLDKDGCVYWDHILERTEHHG